MTAEIISVGTELLLGNILNTNAQYLSRELAALGITVRRQSTIGDNHDRLADFVNEAKQRCDLLVFTGGLGLHGGAERIGATGIPASTGNTARQITMLQDYGSTMLCCTPSYALYIGDTMEKNNIPVSSIHLKAGLFGAEPWTVRMKEEIEKRLGIRAYDI